MKALSIYPEPVMEIFMGDKTTEYRDWHTDYRGDLLICAGAKPSSGYVSGQAWLVAPLLDIRPIDGGEPGASGRFEWRLGAPRLIRPIPVRGRLCLFDVPDGRIEYIEGGDLGAYPTPREADAFRRAYALEYLAPLAHCPDGAPFGGVYSDIFAPKGCRGEA